MKKVDVGMENQEYQPNNIRIITMKYLLILDKIENFFEKTIHDKVRWSRTVIAGVIIYLVVVHIMGCM